jgi:predicted GNAT family acetyltransferase
MVTDVLVEGIEVVEVPAALRFEAHSTDGEILGTAEYQRMGTVVAFTRTEVPQEYAGRGIGSTLIGEAMDLVRASGRQVIPYCPFVRSWLTRHPDYLDLVVRPKARTG